VSIPPDEQALTARKVLVQILKENGPLLGSKLKVRLTAVLGQELGVPREAWHSLVPRLSHFLAANSDLVEIHRSGAGDIHVSLRDRARNTSTAEAGATKVWYRPEVWKAFVNPDPDRRRFFHRHTHELVHLLMQPSGGPDSPLAERVSKDSEFVPIEFADAETQQGWLREFLDTTPLISESHKRVARHFLELPFDTSINAAFAASLGPHGDAWKRFRAKKLDDFITAWAQRNGVDSPALKRLPPKREDTERTTAAEGAVLNPPQPSGTASLSDGGESRHTLLALVESLDDTELRQVLVPLSAVDRILRRLQ
jgi:hypothetical protein